MTIKNDEEAITTTMFNTTTTMFNTQRPRGLSGLVNYVRFGIG